MRAMEIADEFRAQFIADAAFAGIAIHNVQSTEPFTCSAGKSSVILEVVTKPLDGAGRAASYVLRAIAVSTADRRQDGDPDPATVHEQLLEKVRVKLLALPASPAPQRPGYALRQALNTASTKFDFRGWVAGDPDDSVVKDHHFETPIVLRGAVLAL